MSAAKRDSKLTHPYKQEPQERSLGFPRMEPWDQIPVPPQKSIPIAEGVPHRATW